MAHPHRRVASDPPFAPPPPFRALTLPLPSSRGRSPISPSSYLESSATAGFAYGILLSLRKGFLKGGAYEAAALRSVKGLVGRIAPDGELADVRCALAALPLLL